jgi:hypothetical protein
MPSEKVFSNTASVDSGCWRLPTLAPAGMAAVAAPRVRAGVWVVLPPGAETRSCTQSAPWEPLCGDVRTGASYHGFHKEACHPEAAFRGDWRRAHSDAGRQDVRNDTMRQHAEPRANWGGGESNSSKRLWRAWARRLQHSCHTCVDGGVSGCSGGSGGGSSDRRSCVHGLAWRRLGLEDQMMRPDFPERFQALPWCERLMGGGNLLETISSSGWRSGRRAAAGGSGVGAGGRPQPVGTAALCSAALPPPVGITHAARDRQVRRTRPAVPREAAAMYCHFRWQTMRALRAEVAVQLTVAANIDENGRNLRL